MKGVMRFGKKGKLSPRYIGPYEILQPVGNIAYELKLPNHLASIHPMFHVSMHKMFVGDQASVLPVKRLGVNEIHSNEEVPIEILYCQVKKMRNNEVATIKVLWRNHLVKGATWESEADIRSR